MGSARPCPQGQGLGQRQAAMGGLEAALPAAGPQAPAPAAPGGAWTCSATDYGARRRLERGRAQPAKGVSDAFYCVDTPWAALGLARAGPARGRRRLAGPGQLQRRGAGAGAAFTGEEKLAWEAAGLPLNAWAAWELYHRDPTRPRAARFPWPPGRAPAQRVRLVAAQPGRRRQRPLRLCRDEEKPLEAVHAPLDFPVASSPSSGVLAARHRPRRPP